MRGVVYKGRMALTAQTEITIIEQDYDSVATDTLSSDSVPPYGMELNYGLLLHRPEALGGEPAGSGSPGMSWLLTGLFVVYTVVCLRYRKNSRYFSMILNEIVEVRERHNAFDDTLRETSFVWLLNLLWCGGAGILLYGYLYPPVGADWLAGLGVSRLFLCMGIMVAYTLFMALAYGSVALVFTDGGKSSLWVKSFLSTRGLEGIALFPVALLGLCVPGMVSAMIILGIIIFIIAKLLFIYKSFCIFFADSATWVLFLYYLCSLEIVPVVLAFSGARFFCNML